MIERILVAVDDSTPALEAARFAIGLATALSASLDVVTVRERGRDPAPIGEHVRALAADRAVGVEVLVRHDGEHPFEVLLATAAERRADLIVVGRSGVRSGGRPHVGSQTEHLLEFTEIPVVVVPGR